MGRRSQRPGAPIQLHRRRTAVGPTGTVAGDRPGRAVARPDAPSVGCRRLMPSPVDVSHATRGTTRDRMLFTAAQVLREKGAAGVTIDEVLARSGAPRGSVYHHFPGGRSQLLTEALQFAGERDHRTRRRRRRARAAPR